MVSSLTMPFLREHVLPFKIREKVPNRIERIVWTIASTVLFYLAQLKSRFGVASLKDRLRLADSFLADGIAARIPSEEQRVRNKYQNEYVVSNSESYNQLNTSFFKDVTREPFVFVNEENISRVRNDTTENRKNLYLKLQQLISSKFNVLAPCFNQFGTNNETCDETTRVFGYIDHVFQNKPESEKEKFVKDFSGGYGLVIDEDRYRLVFHRIDHFDFKEQHQEGIVGCRREYTFTKKDVEAYDNHLKFSDKFPELKVTDIYSPMLFCKPGEALALKDKIIRDLYKNVPRVIYVLE